MFLQNKYTDLYFKLIKNDDHSEYQEKHHIIPKCLDGDDNDINLKSMSARKHFLCHYLLIKMIDPNDNRWFKLVKAFIMMNAGHNGLRYLNSRLYESQRINFSKALSIAQTGSNNSQFNTCWVTNFNLKHSKRISVNELQTFIKLGYKKCRCMDFSKFDNDGNRLSDLKRIAQQSKNNQKRTNRQIRRLQPFYDRFINGESIRTIAKDYPSSHQSLHRMLQKYFK